MKIELKSTITCPKCGHKKEEEMPTDACQYFYECENCKTVLKPINNDCCVYCSYGTVPCPPIQEYKNTSCCSEDSKIIIDNSFIAESCNIGNKGESCCSTTTEINNEVNLKEHWDKAYLNSPENKLGWYETDLSPMFKLIVKTGLNKLARISIVGAGSTTLVDELLDKGYSNIIATDISEVALKKLENRVGNINVEFIIDDLIKPTELKNIKSVDLWIDRAVLHFFTEINDKNTYFDLLKSKIQSKGYVILAEYNLNGAKRCAGLPVYKYSKEMIIEELGTDFELIDSFNYTYIMPSGAERPYIYTLFRKK